MKKRICDICKKEILDGEFWATAEIPVGGPVDGTSEWADDYRVVYAHLDCVDTLLSSINTKH